MAFETLNETLTGGCSPADRRADPRGDPPSAPPHRSIGSRIEHSLPKSPALSPNPSLSSPTRRKSGVLEIASFWWSTKPRIPDEPVFINPAIFGAPMACSSPFGGVRV